MNSTVLLGLAGGLGLFLFGMNLMSEGIEKAAGAKLRNILELFTKNKFMGMIVGILFTGIIQSSSACTVMVVSFVNSGLMNLYQAAGVIFGANIGTTVTSQLVSFNLSKIAPLFVLIGVVMVSFIKNETAKKIGDIILGFGVLFMGLSTMSSSMSSLKESQEVVNALAGLDNPFLAVLLGTAVTSVIQSSSVTVSIILLMANQGLLELNIVLYIILGCNIGACASAMIASLSGKKDAKRAALIHLLFNIIGTVILFVILQVASGPVISMIQSFSADNGRFVANAHTLIKIFQVIVLFPFSSLIVKMTYLLIPGEDKKVGYREVNTLKYIGDKVVFNPATAVVEVIKEIERMGDLASENLNRAMNGLITLDEEDINEVYEVEKNINFLNHAITNYLVKINQTNLPIEDLK
ncbi:MAG: Na/Pi cotransporter family protein, partial [Lachnospiraceae bacterium]|nr:Na/Pi cotransporter family protein [Lachnospiraceae bacterium]